MLKIKRVTRKTLLIIGEGAHELAFLKHLKAVFGSSELEITIDASNGGSPNDVCSCLQQLTTYRSRNVCPQP